MRSAECGVRSAECEKCGMGSAEWGVRNAECGMRSAEWGVRNGECGMGPLAVTVALPWPHSSGRGFAVLFLSRQLSSQRSDLLRPRGRSSLSAGLLLIR